MKKRNKIGQYIFRPNEIIYRKNYAGIILEDAKGNPINITLISLDDIVYIKSTRWGMGTNGYSSGKVKNKRIFLHRFILKAKDGQIIDHKNGNVLDNRRENLRFCTRSENRRNAKSSGGKSKFKGVTYDLKKKLFRARICVNRKRKGLGRFKNELDAARAYDRAAKKFHLEFARTNEQMFPEVFIGSV